MFCAECGADNMRRTDEPIEEFYKDEKITVSNVDHWVCDSCGELEFSASDLGCLKDALDSEYRRIKGLLTPQQIKKIRTDLGLKQKEFERILRVTSPTVSRWETGSVVQSETTDLLLRGITKYPCLADDLMARAEIKREENDPHLILSACATFNRSFEAAEKRAYSYV